MTELFFPYLHSNHFILRSVKMDDDWDNDTTTTSPSGGGFVSL